MDTQAICEHCGATFNRSIKYCPFCGGERISEPTNEVPRCPRCTCKLEPHKYRRMELDLCPQCSGLWLDTDEFTRLTSERDVYADDSIPYRFIKRPAQGENGYLPCARCGTLMPRKNFRRISGVLIDVCRDHGVWLDAGELEQIRCFIANGGLERSQDKEILENRMELKSLAERVGDVESMQKILHRWDIRRWLIAGF